MKKQVTVFEVVRTKYRRSTDIEIDMSVYSIGLFKTEELALLELEKVHGVMTLFSEKWRGTMTKIKDNSFQVYYVDENKRDVERDYQIVERVIQD